MLSYLLLTLVPLLGHEEYEVRESAELGIELLLLVDDEASYALHESARLTEDAEIQRRLHNILKKWRYSGWVEPAYIPGSVFFAHDPFELHPKDFLLFLVSNYHGTCGQGCSWSGVYYSGDDSVSWHYIHTLFDFGLSGRQVIRVIERANERQKYYAENATYLREP